MYVHTIIRAQDHSKTLSNKQQRLLWHYELQVEHLGHMNLTTCTPSSARVTLKGSRVKGSIPRRRELIYILL